MGLKPVTYISHKGELLAILVRPKEMPEGHHFVTSPSESLQTGVISFKRGTEILPHFHVSGAKLKRGTAEVVVLQEGRCEVTLYSIAGKKVFTAGMEKGDLIVVLRGGHGFRFLTNARLLEVKQGPYLRESKRDLFSSKAKVKRHDTRLHS